MDADIFVPGKKKLPIQKYPDTCGRGLSERTEFNKSCILIGSGSGRNFPIGPTLGGRNRHLLKNVSILSGNLLNNLCYYVSKNLSVKPLSSTLIISVFITICSLEIVQFVANLAMITALKYSSPKAILI